MITQEIAILILSILFLSIPLTFYFRLKKDIHTSFLEVIWFNSAIYLAWVLGITFGVGIISFLNNIIKIALGV